MARVSLDGVFALFATKLVIELHDLSHEMFDQVLAKNAVLTSN
jgi:hypothetical protein